MKQIIIYLSLFLPAFLYGQRFDSKWLLGYGADGSGIPYGLNELAFQGNNMTLSFQNELINFGTTRTAMYDSLGNLLFCTNGIHIWNPNRDTMENGSGLSPSDYTSSQNIYGLNIPQGVIALPVPNRKNVFYLLHETVKWLDVHGSKPWELYYSEIDMNENVGMGKVTAKNQIALNDTLDIGQITACKHGNGRDYWVLVSRYLGEGFHRLLVTNTGISYEGLQIIGKQERTAAGSQSVFSPDGSKYLRYRALTEFKGRVDIFNFDRCIGLLNFADSISVPLDNGMWQAAGCAISPNSKVLYFCVPNKMYQYDLTAPNIAASEYLVATYDGFQSPFGSTFFQGQLAPDGKIYWSCTNGENVLHVINQPDSLGSACDFQQHGIQLLSYNAFGLPNHPNYYLGAKVGSACDTLGLSNEEGIGKSEKVKIYPNPAQNYVQVELPQGVREATFVLRNALGQVVQQTELQASTLVRLGNVATGLYFYEVIFKEGEIYGKLQIE